MGTPDIKVITGVRRSGKSKLLEAFKAHIQKCNTNANIIHINFNLPEYDALNEYKALYYYVNSNYQGGKENFVLIDEVQMCNDFEKAISKSQNSKSICVSREIKKKKRKRNENFIFW